MNIVALIFFHKYDSEGQFISSHTTKFSGTFSELAEATKTTREGYANYYVFHTLTIMPAGIHWSE